MSDERKETVSDIMSEMREYADSMEKHLIYDLSECSTDYLRVLADRIEAAAKRERETTREKSSAVGNAAEMREALVMVKRLFDCRLMWQSDIRKAHEAVNSALAESPRNCDVGTVKERSERVFKFCTPKRCDECKSHEDDSFYGCVLRWSQMPYDEGGAK